MFLRLKIEKNMSKINFVSVVFPSPDRSGTPDAGGL